MPRIKIETEIKIDIKDCFDLARNIDFHQKSLKYFDETVVAGKMSGLAELGEWVSWEGRYLGFVQHLTSKIIEFDSPNYFATEMVFGAFKSFRHEHYFEEKEGFTLMTNVFYFKSPLGLLGEIVNKIFLKRYLIKVLKSRNQYLKEKGEGLVINNA